MLSLDVPLALLALLQEWVVACFASPIQFHIPFCLPARVELDEDLPAHGQHFCIACSRYFISEVALQDHQGTKPHRRCVAAGLGPQVVGWAGSLEDCTDAAHALHTCAHTLPHCTWLQASEGADGSAAAQPGRCGLGGRHGGARHWRARQRRGRGQHGPKLSRGASTAAQPGGTCTLV